METNKGNNKICQGTVWLLLFGFAHHFSFHFTPNLFSYQYLNSICFTYADPIKFNKLLKYFHHLFIKPNMSPGAKWLYEISSRICSSSPSAQFRFTHRHYSFKNKCGELMIIEKFVSKKWSVHFGSKEHTRQREGQSQKGSEETHRNWPDRPWLAGGALGHTLRSFSSNE